MECYSGKSSSIYDKMYSTLLSGDLEAVQAFIDTHNLYYQPKWSEGYFLLCTAIVKKQTEIAKILLLKSDTIGNDEFAQVPFSLAIAYDCEEIVKILIKKGANINLPNRYGQTPLFFAIKANNVSIIRLLIILGANVNGVLDYRSGYTPLCLAAEIGHIEIVALLLQHGAQVNYSNTCSPEYSNFSKHCNVEEKDKKRFPLLLRGRSIDDVKNIQKMSPLHLATYWDHLYVVVYLLDNNADINAGCIVICEQNYTPLHLAADRGSLDMVKLLLATGALVDGKDDQMLTPLHIAIMKKHHEVVEYLINYGADIFRPFRHLEHYNEYLPLHLAAVVGSLDIIKILIKYGADVDCLTPQNMTSLHLAMKRDYDGAILDYLIESGARTDIVDMKGKTALHKACEVGNLGVIVPLLEHGFNINASDKFGKTPLKCIGDGVNGNSCHVYQHFNIINPDDNNFADPIYQALLHSKIMAIVTRYLTMLETAVSHNNSLPDYSNGYYYTNSDRNSSDQLIEFRAQCQIEISHMKNRKLNKNNITFYDILSNSIDELTAVLKNQEITKILSSLDFVKPFPIYGSMLNNKLRRALRKTELVEQCKTIITIYCKESNLLPNIESAFNSLNNRQLVAFINNYSYLS